MCFPHALTGVAKNGDVFTASIEVDENVTFLGIFVTAEAAATAYDT